MPVGPPFNDKGLEKIRFSHFDPKKKTWYSVGIQIKILQIYDGALLTRVMRDVPLNDEELECWVEQAKWRKYTLTSMSALASIAH